MFFFVDDLVSNRKLLLLLNSLLNRAYIGASLLQKLNRGGIKGLA